jgi:hypothetical protein
MLYIGSQDHAREEGQKRRLRCHGVKLATKELVHLYTKRIN